MAGPSGNGGTTAPASPAQAPQQALAARAFAAYRALNRAGFRCYMVGDRIYFEDPDDLRMHGDLIRRLVGY